MRAGLFLATGLAALWMMGLDAPVRAEVSEADFFADVPVVLTVSRLSQALADAPAAVSIIDRDMIRASGFTDIADLFRLVPGMNVAYFSGALPTVTYHGLGDGFSRRMQVLVDGRSIYSAHFGQVFWRNLALTLDDIERIEVVRGPAAASYGANAFAGVINIITRHPAETQGVHGEAQLGGNEVRNAQVRIGAQSGDLVYRLTLGRRGDDRFKDYPDDVRERFVEARADYRLNANDELTAQFGTSHAATELSFALPNHPADAADTYVQVRWRRVLEANREWSLTYDYTQQGVDERVDPPAVTVPLNFDFSTRRHNLGRRIQPRSATRLNDCINT
jgi:iron complex outermembrane receptor protein